MLIRVAKNPHRSQQRFGFLKYLTHRASQTDSTTTKALGTDLLNTVTKKINVELRESLKTYIEQRLRNQFENIIQNQTRKVYIEIQDFYLSDPKVPSKTGKLYMDDLRRYPYLLSSLGFARENTYSPLVRGKVFLEFVSKEELRAFTKCMSDLNPFLLNNYQKYICLYSLIENDGDVLKPLYAQLLKLKSTFSDWTAGDFLPEIYEEIINVYKVKVTTGIDRDRLNDLAESAKRIEKWVKKPRTGGRSAKIDAITPRLEPLTDLGLLEKQDVYGYKYNISEHGKALFKLFCSDEDMSNFLVKSFFSSLNKSFKLKAKLAEEDEIIEALFEAFNRIKSPLGYAPIKEIALLGAIKSLVDNTKYFEVGEATKRIMDFQKSHPYDVRFQVDRSGAPVYVKFLNSKNEREY